MIYKAVKYCSIIGSMMFVAPNLVAQNVTIYPVPQEMKVHGATFKVPSSVAISGLATADSDAISLLKKLFPTAKSMGKAKYMIHLAQGGSARAGLKPVSGAYRLKISDDEISISAYDNSGMFYAVQSLSQLLKDGKLQPCEINDYPDVPFRGTVEGFYGAPWKHSARLSQIEFYGKYKLNAYIYGPKDDPFHGFSNRWREPYPADKAEQIKELAKVAQANKVNFIWAVHPGADVHWVDRDGDGIIDDFVNCLKKFEMMYDLGVRSFAVFFDDIGGEGAKPQRQAEMLNYLNRNFVKKKKDVTPLVMCPTQYNKAWSGGDYLDILGSQMDKDIDIMWTGNSVCTDITSESVNWINNRIKRNAYIWWNWPVTDYCRSQLLLGRTYGVEAGNKGKLSGFTSNPMDKPEASKIALFGVADYTWNMEKFNSEKSWKDGIKSLYPKFYKDMQIFANHNSDQGASYHNYRREESAEFLPVIESAKKEYDASAKYSNDTATKLIAEFKSMQKSGENLIKEIPKFNNELFFEIEFWIRSLISTGNLGHALVNMVQASEQNLVSKIAAVNTIITEYEKLDDFYNSQKKRAEDGSTPNDRRWAKGAHTASKVVAPFLKDHFQKSWQKIQNNAGMKVANTSTDIFKSISNLPLYANLQVERAGKFVSIKRSMEVATLKKGEFLGIELPEGIFANYVHIKLDNKNLANFGHIEISSDGKKWTKLDSDNSGEEMQKSIDLNSKIRFARYICTSNNSVEIKINQFKLDIPEDSKINSQGAMVDGDINSSFAISSQTIVPSTIKNGANKVFVVKSNNTKANITVIYNDGTKAKYKATGKKHPKKIKAVEITPTNDKAKIYEVLFL